MNFLNKILNRRKKQKKIGRVEKVNIPTLNLYNIDAKIDTGAYRGTIHAEDIQLKTKDKKEVLEFKVVDHSHPEDRKIIHYVENFKIGKVRSSQGPYEDRFFVPVVIELAGEKIKADLSLSNRKELRYPILIGRKILKKLFLIDVNGKYINNYII